MFGCLLIMYFFIYFIFNIYIDINIIMQTIKLKYQTSDKNLKIILDFQRQYSSCLHYLYNRFKDNPSITEKELRSYQKDLNNIDLIKSYLFQCIIKEAKLLASDCKSIIFGGKKLFFKRMKNLISKDEFKIKRLNPIYIIGEKLKHSNRFVQINSDLNSIMFKPSKDYHIELQLIGVKNRKDILEKLYFCQLNNLIPITYKINHEYIYISFDETILASNDYMPVKNRVFAIDLNPNYIGWSITDWKSSSDFDIVRSGVYSIKDLNDYDFSLNKQGLASNSKQRRYVSNKRRHESFQISKNLINIARYYRCELFGIEDLNIKSSNKEKGSRFNKLCNNIWNRNALINNLSKRCNVFGIKMIKVKANYSSFIGNLLFRNLNMPDIVLASIEIGRRAFEFNLQYIKKEKEIQHNIIQPKISDFKDLVSKSLEEFGVKEKFESLIDLYYVFKNSKLKYRVPLGESLEFYRFFSFNSKIKRLFYYF